MTTGLVSLLNGARSEPRLPSTLKAIGTRHALTAADSVASGPSVFEQLMRSITLSKWTTELWEIRRVCQKQFPIGELRESHCPPGIGCSLHAF
jgi:hypothetical protein